MKTITFTDADDRPIKATFADSHVTFEHGRAGQKYFCKEVNDLMGVLANLVHPGAVPLVLYMNTQADADELLQIILEVKPNMVANKV